MLDTDGGPISRGLPDHGRGCCHSFRPGVRLRKPWGVETLLARAAGYELWELLIEPGADTSLHLHRKKTTWLDVLQGSGILVIGEETLALAPGATAQVPALRPHRVGAASDAALLVWEPESPPDKADIKRLADRHRRAGRPFLYGSRILSPFERGLPGPACEVRLFEEACARLASLVVAGGPGPTGGSAVWLLAAARRWTLVRRTRDRELGHRADRDAYRPSSFRAAK